MDAVSSLLKRILTPVPSYAFPAKVQAPPLSFFFFLVFFGSPR